MAVHKLFIMQTDFDGISYTKGLPVDTLTAYNVVCRDFPFKLFPDTKDVVTKNWKGSHGADAYIPSVNMIKDYDIDVQFLYVGTHSNMRTQIGKFIKFLNGMVGAHIVPSYGEEYDETAVGARLAIYDQYTQIGRKDIRVSSVEFGGWWDMPDFDTDCIADFKVRFHVFDPVTDVTPTYSGGQINTMVWI